MKQDHSDKQQSITAIVRQRVKEGHLKEFQHR